MPIERFWCKTANACIMFLIQTYPAQRESMLNGLIFSSWSSARIFKVIKFEAKIAIYVMLR